MDPVVTLTMQTAADQGAPPSWADGLALVGVAMIFNVLLWRVMRR